MRDNSFSFLSSVASSESLAVGVGGIVAKVHKSSKQYQLSSDKVKTTIKLDNTKARGTFWTIDLKQWKEIPAHMIDSNRVGVGRSHSGKEAIVYIQINEEEPGAETDTCKKYLLLPQKCWVDYRSPRGEGKFQGVDIDSNGTIYVSGYKVLNIRVFVPVEKKVKVKQVKLRND